MSLKLYWNSSISNLAVDGLGFLTANEKLKEYLEKAGVIFTRKADRTLAHIGAHLYKPVRDKKNFFWCPIESNRVYKGAVDSINKADVVIASCEDNKKAMIESGVTKPIKVCNLGVDLNIYKYKERKREDTFRFLWLGMNSLRKGWDVVVKAFQKAFSPDENVTLFLKTVTYPPKIWNIMGRVTIDSRNYSIADLLDLYEAHHVFVFPTRGEASGLPVLEAMASGLLVLAPSIQGLKDFVNKDTAIVLKTEKIRAWYGCDIEAPNVGVDELAEKMRWAYENYEDTLKLRENARRLMEKKFSWEKVTEKLIKIIWEEESETSYI